MICGTYAMAKASVAAMVARGEVFMGFRYSAHVLGLCCVTLGMASFAGAQSPAAALQPALLPEPAGTSQVRVVRLSQVQGLVQMDRAAGRGYEQAIMNMPVVGRARLRTGQGVAEVEFEDNSSLRLAPDSEVRFAQLSRTPDGATITTVTAVHGTVYVSLRSGKTGSFALNDGAAHMLLTPGTHLRLRAGEQADDLAVWQGSTELQLGGADTLLRKKQSLSFDPAQNTISAINGGVEQVSWDGWDHQATQYHDVRANQAFGTGSAFGAGDLGYYGSFASLPGCGSVWQPYLVGAGWSPYDNGSWALYQGGYSWVSPYPWGWLPYHSGSWVNCGGAGWGWRPGAEWYGLHNASGGMTLTQGGMTSAPRLPGRPLPFPTPPGNPTRTAGSLIQVSAHPLPVSGVDARGEHFVFRQNSAGLGVPRGSMGDMRRASMQVEQHGLATRTIAGNTGSLVGVSTAAAPWGSATPGGGSAPQSMHRSAASTSTPSGTGGHTYSAPSVGSMHSSTVSAGSSGVGASAGGGSSARSH